ncbi:hypothetical protein ACSFCW_23870 [Yokenella regensburgei]|uniref:hypothetical protein n=1 Tax=Yokenella regensburgei TaxID=158877 RepID=UPI003EDAAA31
MQLCVVGALYQQPGLRHEYQFSDGSVAVESPSLPSVSQWIFYDSHNHRIVNKSAQAAMKAAISRHKKKWKCK